MDEWQNSSNVEMTYHPPAQTVSLLNSPLNRGVTYFNRTNAKKRVCYPQSFLYDCDGPQIKAQLSPQQVAGEDSNPGLASAARRRFNPVEPTTSSRVSFCRPVV